MLNAQFDAEFRRFSLSRQRVLRFDDFYHLVENLHTLQSVPFIITYTDPEGDLLPINNDENFAVALSSAQPVLRLHIQQKGLPVHYIPLLQGLEHLCVSGFCLFL